MGTHRCCACSMDVLFHAMVRTIDIVIAAALCSHACRRGAAGAAEDGDRDDGGGRGGSSSRRWRSWSWRCSSGASSVANMLRHGWEDMRLSGCSSSVCGGYCFRCSSPLRASTTASTYAPDEVYPPHLITVSATQISAIPYYPIHGFTMLILLASRPGFRTLDRI
jgi:hypothetical protein